MSSAPYVSRTPAPNLSGAAPASAAASPEQWEAELQAMHERMLDGGGRPGVARP